jgi:hypothetical protein
MRTRVRAVSILGAATLWTGHSLKIRIGGRSPRGRLVAGLLFTASRTEPASYAYLRNVFASETGHVIHRAKDDE